MRWPGRRGCKEGTSSLVRIMPSHGCVRLIGSVKDERNGKGIGSEKERKVIYLLVTSSKSRTFLSFLNSALAIPKSCFCPCDRHSSSIAVSSPPFAWITLHSCTFCNASTISLSVAELVGSAFNRALPSKMYGS